MQIVILGPRVGSGDEAMARWTLELHRGLLDLNHQSALVEFRKPYLLAALCSALALPTRADIIHYVPGASLMSLGLLRLLKALHPTALTVLSVCQPRIGRRGSALARRLRPDIVLAQSSCTADRFRSLGCRTMTIPGGVDWHRFRPLASEERSKRRGALGLAPKDFVVLHVGPIRSSRRLPVLARIQQLEEVQVVVVGSTASPQDTTVLRHLRDSGCIVMTEYVPNVEEIYQAADCYLFPAESAISAVETPLSVLEAMACGLPVVTTRFGSLPCLFPNSGGISYASTDEDMLGIVERLRKSHQFGATRHLVQSLHWPLVIQRIEHAYRSALSHLRLAPNTQGRLGPSGWI